MWMRSVIYERLARRGRVCLLRSMYLTSKDNMLAGILNGMIGPGAGRLGPRDGKVGGGPSGAP